MRIREIKEKDYELFADFARAEDVAECLSVSNKPLAERIKYGKECSVESYAFVDDNDRACALYGIYETCGVYCVWLLTTVFIEEHKLSFMKRLSKVVKKWYKVYGPLHVLTDLRYERAKKLINWAGFERVGENISINGVDFGLYRFSGEK